MEDLQTPRACRSFIAGTGSVHHIYVYGLRYLFSYVWMKTKKFFPRRSASYRCFRHTSTNTSNLCVFRTLLDTPYIPLLFPSFPQKLYCSGNGASIISIEGGIFRNNQALDSGGALSLWGEKPKLTITGGTFEGNRAT